MPAILKPGSAERLRKVGRADELPQEDKPDPKIEQMAGQIAALSDKLAGLNEGQMQAVMALAAKADRDSKALVTALTTLLQDRPKTMEKWDFHVTERDHAGRIVTLKAEQTA